MMNPSNPRTWTRTAIEYAVMSALSIHGYKDVRPDCGYSRHSCMVPDPKSADSHNPDFCDFTVVSSPDLFDHYVRKTLKSKRIKLTQPEGTQTAELSSGDTLIQHNSSDNFYHNACLAILEWFEIRSVPMSVHYFEDELAEYLSAETA